MIGRMEDRETVHQAADVLLDVLLLSDPDSPTADVEMAVAVERLWNLLAIDGEERTVQVDLLLRAVFLLCEAILVRAYGTGFDRKRILTDLRGFLEAYRAETDGDF